jgi:hypothetical protein
MLSSFCKLLVFNLRLTLVYFNFEFDAFYQLRYLSEAHPYQIIVCPDLICSNSKRISSANLAKAIPILSTSALVLGSIAIPITGAGMTQNNWVFSSHNVSQF